MGKKVHEHICIVAGSRGLFKGYYDRFGATMDELKTLGHNFDLIIQGGATNCLDQHARSMI